MKKEKLNLNALKVESFVTSINDNNANTLKGGSTPECAATIISMVSVATDFTFTIPAI
jgi:hypothetical protein